MVTKRILDHSEQYMRATQYGFREKQGCADALLAIRLILERVAKISEYDVTALFLVRKKAFDSVTHDALGSSLKEQGVDPNHTFPLNKLYDNQTEGIKTYCMSDSFNIVRGVKQGDPLSSLPFNSGSESLMWKSKENGKANIMA